MQAVCDDCWFVGSYVTKVGTSLRPNTPPCAFRSLANVLMYCFCSSTVKPGTPKPSFEIDARSDNVNATVMDDAVTPLSDAVRPGTGLPVAAPATRTEGA